MNISLACGIGMALAWLAAMPAANGAVLGEEWHAVRTDVLAQQRGGFTTVGGLELSLGIERLVSINGDLVARTSLQIADVRSLSAEQAGLAREALSAGQLVQTGANNLVNGALDLGASTVVQNTLNDQTIRSQTVISSSVNSLSLLKNMNFQDTVRQAALAGIGSR